MEVVHWLVKRVRQRLLDRRYAVGAVLADRYTVEKVLQNGSYGLIYLCVDNETGERCVVKQMRKSKRKENRENYQEETAILERLDHSGIPALIGTFQFEGESFFSMAFVKGKNVEDTLFATGRTFSERECLTLIHKLTVLVCYCHQNGVFHGDIRIPNVLLDGDDVQLIDFGLAHTAEQNSPDELRQLVHDDLFDLGDFLLFLLYSSYDGGTKRGRPWTEELDLHPATAHLLKRLLQLEPPFDTCEQVLAALQDAMDQLK